VWIKGAATYAVAYYDGKPHGVDRSSFYQLARDHVGTSAVEKDEDGKLNGSRAHLRLVRVGLPGKPVQWRRSALVVVDDRTYDVSCTTSNQADVGSPLTEAFFGSFRVDLAK
jgi:hypothetical protein